MQSEQQPETRQPKLEWVKPEVRRITAGSAEDNLGPATDANNNPS
jgi:hypothetical protein